MLTDLTIKPTLRCIARCEFCSERQALHRDQRRTRWLDVAEWQALFVQAHGLGVQRLAISGGEPTLYPGLVALVRHGKSLGWRVELRTNGGRLDLAQAHQLAEAGLDQVLLSLHGARPGTHDRLRGLPGLWHKAIAARQHLATAAAATGHDVRVVVQTILCSQNLEEFAKLLRLACRLHVDGVLICHVENDAQRRHHLLDEAAIARFRGSIVPAAVRVVQEEIADRVVRRLAIGALHRLFARPGITAAQYATGIYRPASPCHKPACQAIVLASGDVHPCNMVEYSRQPVVGNLRDHSLAQLWRGPAWSAFRRSGFDLCAQCPVPDQTYVPLGQRPAHPLVELCRGVPRLQPLVEALTQQARQWSARRQLVARRWRQPG